MTKTVPLEGFFARDFFSQLTPDEFAALQITVSGNPALGLLWASLLAQGDAPILPSSPRFQQGWAVLINALSPERAAEIATALGIPT